MRLHVILIKTLVDLLSLKRTIALVILGMIPVIIMTIVFKYLVMVHPMSLQMETHTLIGIFTVLLFMWVAGFYLVVSVSATAANFISKEDTEGTLLIMISKPLHMFEVVLGKLLALIINTMLLQVVILLLSAVIFWFVLPIDPETLTAFLRLIPVALLYSLLVTVVFGSIAIALSTLMKSRVKITLVLMIVAVLIFFVGMIPRAVFTQYYETYYLYWGDLGYHLGNTFAMIMDHAGTGQMMPMIQMVMSIFTGIYVGVEESIDPDIGAFPPTLELTNYVDPVVSAALWLGVFAIALTIAMWAIERKEIN